MKIEEVGHTFKASSQGIAKSLPVCVTFQGPFGSKNSQGHVKSRSAPRMGAIACGRLHFLGLGLQHLLQALKPPLDPI